MPLTPNQANPSSGDADDDYMSMVIEEPRGKETWTQRKLRQQREAEARARVPSKAERAAAEEARREEALSSSVLDPSNKGFKMMAKLGFKPGDSLGKQSSTTESVTTRVDETAGAGAEGSAASTVTASDWVQSRAEPLRLVVKDDRGGIGLESEKKRKFREEVVDVSKKAKAEEGEYRDRMRLEREERRVEAQVHAAQKVAEKLDTEAEEYAQDTVERDDGEGGGQSSKKKPVNMKPTSQINILYRGLVRERQERERERLVRQALETSLPSSFFPKPRLPGTREEESEDQDDEHATGPQQSRDLSYFEEEQDEEDPELDEFNALEATEKLHRLVMFMRDKFQYCFWCKYRYEDDKMEGCPGITEEDHD
ncbi:hypothetical protein BGW36DRAFT_357758 [Talaromyces proteolyticus]|uniref:G-patch domain-containing protein n=1 Tax=Talaromyces proteolyticus TaxID=1131652 RepID=A0AAD4KW74_9EURO|nr:uncharacterized protein BGW36DRAFT_357758 [Talaromyces proteolyticus]KAH8701131.1 hypothetical protein BGW36DRAFT_357758 [Talaromyces proteolyticus]